MNRRAAFTFFRHLTRCSLSNATRRTRFVTGFVSVTTATMGLCLSWPFSPYQPPSLDERSREHLYKSNCLIAQKRFHEADAELHELLKLLADSASANQLTPVEYAERRARVFAELANLRLLMGDTVNAEGLLIQTMRDAVAGGVRTEDAMIVDISLKLALVYMKLGQPEMAASGFDYCVSTQRKNVENSTEENEEIKLNNLALLGRIYNLYSHFLIIQGNLKKGKEMLESALEKAREVYPGDHRNCFNILSDLAHVASLLGDVDLARLCFQEAIDLTGQNRDEVRAFLYTQWAMLEGSDGNFEAADHCIAEALKSCSKIIQATDREMTHKDIEEVDSILTKWKVALESNEDIISE